MITIKMYNKKWQVHIQNEIWEVSDLTQLRRVIDQLLIMKETYGMDVEKWYVLML